MHKRFKKLIAYSSGAGAFLVLHGDCSAQIIYHDIDPDTTITNDVSYALDFNDDGIADIQFNGLFDNGSCGTYCVINTRAFSIYNFDAVIRNPDHDLLFGAKVMHTAEVISNAGDWNSNDHIYFGTFYKYFAFGSCSSAYWLETNYHYDSWKGESLFLGVRFNIDGAAHYGWVRLSMQDYSYADDNLPYLIIQDFAYNALPDTSVIIDYPAAYTAEQLILTDFGESETSSDLHLSFRKAADESTVNSYRVYLFQQYDYPLLTPEIELLMGLPSERYIEVLPSGADVDMYFTDTIKDIEGNAIVPGPLKFYRAIVLSIADGINSSINAISLPSNSQNIQLRSAMPASSVIIYNSGGNCDTTIFSVQFEGKAKQWGVQEYRVFLFDTADDFYTLDSLTAATPDYYVTVPPDATEDYIVNIPSDMKVFYNDLPVLFHIYHSVILSVPDNIYAGTASYTDSQAGWWCNYTEDYWLPVNQEFPVVDIIDSTGSTSDMHIQFPKFADEKLSDYYEIYIVKHDSINNFDPCKANEVLNLFTYKVDASGTDLSVDMPANKKDVDGDIVVPGNLYNVFIGLIRGSDIALSYPSETFTLTEYTDINDPNGLCNLTFSNNILHLMQELENNLSLKILNEVGAIVFSEITVGKELYYDLNYLPAGIYLVIVGDERLNTVKKIIITH